MNEIKNSSNETENKKTDMMTVNEAFKQFGKSINKAFGFPTKEKKTDRELYLQIEHIRHNMFYDLKQLAMIKYKMAVMLTSIVCFTILTAVIVICFFWRW